MISEPNSRRAGLGFYWPNPREKAGWVAQHELACFTWILDSHIPVAQHPYGFVQKDVDYASWAAVWVVDNNLVVELDYLGDWELYESLTPLDRHVRTGASSSWTLHRIT